MEHAVIVHIPLDDNGFGSKARRDLLFALEDQLIEAMQAADAGEFDGNDFGQGECTFFMYGPNADALYEAVEPVLKETLTARNGYAIKRYGPATD